MAVTVLASGAAILAGSVVAGRTYPLAFTVLALGWVVVAVWAALRIHRSRRDT